MLLYMAALVPKHTKPLKGGTSFDCVGQRVASASLLCVLEMHTASIALVFGTSLGVEIPRFSLNLLHAHVGGSSALRAVL
jgi:hypothetical protein